MNTQSKNRTFIPASKEDMKLKQDDRPDFENTLMIVRLELAVSTIELNLRQLVQQGSTHERTAHPKTKKCSCLPSLGLLCTSHKISRCRNMVRTVQSKKIKFHYIEELTSDSDFVDRVLPGDFLFQFCRLLVYGVLL